MVGFSGGFDSMCLLDLLSKVKVEFSLNIVAVHFNHNWRGEEALKEQENCRLFCENKGIEFYTKTASVNVKQTETVARALRYKFFDEAMKKYKSDIFFTAHNQNDNAETILYRIVKGTGLNGLRGIAEKRDNFYRPLLFTSRLSIENYCVDNNLLPNNDSSNLNTKYKRNFIRHEVLPLLKEINPNVSDSLVSLAKVANDENEIIQEYLDKIRETLFCNQSIITKEFMGLSKKVRQHIIYDWILSYNLDYDFEVIDRICKFIEMNFKSKSGISKSLSSDLWLFVNSEIIEIITKKEKLDDIVNVRLNGEYEIGDYIFEITSYFGNALENYPDDKMLYAYVDLSKFDIDFTLRTRRDGDIINPLGMAGSMKLKKYLTGKAVPKHKKDELILLCKANEVLWVPSLGLSDKIVVDKVPTHILMLRKKG